MTRFCLLPIFNKPKYLESSNLNSLRSNKRLSFIRINHIDDYSARSLFTFIIVIITHSSNLLQKSIIIILNWWHPGNKFNICSIIPLFIKILLDSKY